MVVLYIQTAKAFSVSDCMEDDALIQYEIKCYQKLWIFKCFANTKSFITGCAV